MKFSKIIFIGLLLVLFSLSAVSAADDANSTGDLIVQSTSGSDNLAIEDAEIISNDEILKGESSSIVITNGTFTDYFDGEGRILDSVAEGTTLDFRGQITASDTIKAIYINKSVTIISSTKDATITLNSVNGTLGNENITNRFIVDGVSSITISNVIFNRTQMIIFNSSNVVLDNVKIISDDYRIIAESNAQIAETPLVKFENISGFTFKNSYVYVYNLGSRLINCLDVKNAVFDNNMFIVHADSIQIDKRVERIISFSTSVPEYVVVLEKDNSLRIMDTSLNITNNFFEVNYTWSSRCCAYANDILFENNTYVNSGEPTPSIVTSPGFSLRGFNTSNIIVKDNNFPVISVNGSGIVYDNSIKYRLYASGSFLIYNNSIGDNRGFRDFWDVTVSSNSTFCNNTVNGTVGIKGENVIVKDSIMNAIVFLSNSRNITAKNNVINGGASTRMLYDSVTVSSTETYITNNTINDKIRIDKNGNCEIYDNIIGDTISINSKLSIIRDNVISAFDSDYAISIGSGNDCINNEIYNNEIYSKWYCGDNAVSYDENYLNFIEHNTPKIQIDMSVNSTVDIFDYGENTTIVVNVANVKGNVTIDVDGQKYVVGLVNGNASHVITKYSLGLNNVTVIYYDGVNDVWAIDHTNFTVNKVAYCPVDLEYGKLYEGKPSTVNFILPDDAEGTIFVSLTNGFCSVNIGQNANGGNNIISLPGLFEGDYVISASFSSVKYVTNSSSGNVSVAHIPVYQLSVGNVVMDYNDGSEYKVLVIADGVAVGAGEIVKIIFNGITKDIKTDKYGYATLTLDTAPKTYAIKAEYNGVTKSTKVIINNVLKASNISKKKAKTIKFSATLKSSKGKAISGKKITFKINGKTYAAKTNKKGVATISIKGLKVGKYTITSKYGLCAVKNTVKIKK